MAATPAVTVFPALQARNLNGRTLNLPDDFAGAQNIVIIAFRRWHQRLVDSWFPAIEPLQAAHPDLRAYELPIIGSGYSLARLFIDGGMAMAIPSAEVRERTLTVYTDVGKVITQLGIRSPETISVLLVERGGRIRWRTEGEYAADKGAGLARALEGAAR